MRVIVLGAGIVGASIAEQLAVRGADVTVLDMRSPGRGATQASAGMLAPDIEADHGTALLGMCRRSLAMFDGFVARVSASSGRQIEYARRGTIQTSFDHAGADSLRARIAGGALDDLGAEWLDATAVRLFEPALSARVVGGLFLPGHGFVGVASLLSALVDSARLAGAEFHSAVEAALVTSARDGATVAADGRAFEADAVVVATGSWARRVRVANVAMLPMRPIRGQLLHLKWTSGVMPQRVVWGPGCYAVPWSDGSLLVGATSEDAGFDEHSTAAGVRDLTRAVIDLFPASENAAVEAVRVGLRPKLPDELPALGPIGQAPRVIVATGHYRNGVLLSPLTADVVARHLLDGDTDEIVHTTTPDRFFA